MRKLFLFLLFVLVGFVAAEATLRATVYLSNGSVANGSNVSIYNLTYGQGIGGGLIVNYTLLNSTTTDASGTFSLGFDNTSASSQFYFQINYSNTSGIVTDMSVWTMSFGNGLSSLFSTLNSSGLPITLKPATRLHLNATNSSGLGQNFAYILKDNKTSIPIYGHNNISNVSILLPSDGVYILTGYINPTINDGQGSMPISTTIYSANLSSSGSGLAAGRTFVHTINFTTTIINVSGTLTASGNSTSMNFSALRYWVTGGFGAFYGNAQDGALEDPTDSRTGCTATICYLASGNGSYLAKMIGSTGGIDYVLYAEGFDTSGNYYGAMQNITAKSANQVLNLTLRRLLKNITNTSYRNDVNGSRFAVILNNTGGTTSFSSGFMDFTVTDTNSNGAVSYKMFISANASGHFYFPLVKSSYITGTMYTPSYSPRKFSINATNENSTSFVLNVSGMGMYDINGSPISFTTLQFTFFRSNSTCDIPSPSSSCKLFNFTGEDSSSMQTFNPLAYVLAGVNMSFEMVETASNVTAHFLNIDVFNSQPPDFQKTTPNSTSSGSNLETALKVGSLGSSIASSGAFVSFTYDPSVVDEGRGLSIYLKNLFDDDNKNIWNATSNPTGSNIPSSFSDYNQSLFNGSTEGLSCAKNSAYANDTCWVNTTLNRVWLKVPHFSTSDVNLVGPSLATPVTTTAASANKVYITATTSFDCKSGELEVTLSQDPGSGSLRLVDESSTYTSPVQKSITGKTVTFTVSTSSKYSISAVGLSSTYGFNEVKETYTLCPEGEASVEPSAPKPSEVTAEPETPSQPETSSSSITSQDVSSELVYVESLISSQKADGKDTSEAESKFSEAQVAYSSGEYAKAMTLVKEAAALANNAKELPPLKTTTETKPAPKPEPKAEAPSSGSDLSIFLYLGVAVVVILVGYFFLRGKGGKR